MYIEIYYQISFASEPVWLRNLKDVTQSAALEYIDGFRFSSIARARSASLLGRTSKPLGIRNQ